jgi:hypothetical protein
MSPRTFFWASVALFGAIASLAMTYLQRKRRRSLLRDRRRRSPEEFYADFYAGTGINRDAIEYAIGRIASFLCVDAGRLLPTDLLKNYEAISEFESDCDQIYTTLGIAARELGSDCPSMNSIDDAIKILCRLYELRKRRAV